MSEQQAASQFNARMASYPQIEVVTEATRCQLGEGPHWCSKEQVLYYVDILKGRVLRYDPSSRQCHHVDVSENY